MTYILEHKPHVAALVWRRDGRQSISLRALEAQGMAMLNRECWSAWRVVHSRTGETVAHCN